MKKQAAVLLFFVLYNGVLFAQSTFIPNKQLAKPGINWIKITWYNLLPGTTQPDKSKVPDIYMHPNQLLQYNKEGRLMSSMDYQRGSDEASGPTLHCYWDGTHLKKEVQENDQYEAIYTTTYTYDAAGNEIKNETKRGPGDKFGITANEFVESTWVNGQLSKTVYKNYEGVIEKATTFTYDAKGNKIKEAYAPVFLYAAKIFTYDAKGNKVTDTYLDKEGKPSSEWAYEYDKKGNLVKRIYTHYYKGVKESAEIALLTYDDNGSMTSDVVTKDGKTTSDQSWKHSYDAKGNRIQTIHFKNGKAEVVEVLQLTYY
jgi:hypothetical protein